jgi:hypothetical protein
MRPVLAAVLLGLAPSQAVAQERGAGTVSPLQVKKWNGTLGENVVEVAWFELYTHKGRERLAGIETPVDKEHHDNYVRMRCRLFDCDDTIPTIAAALNSAKPSDKACGQPYMAVNFRPRYLDDTSRVKEYLIDRTGRCATLDGASLALDLDLFELIRKPLDQW